MTPQSGGKINLSAGGTGENLKTVVTGGAGFIGSHLVKRLVNAGREVVVIDDLSRGRLEYLNALGVSSAIKFYQVDLRDYPRTLEVLADAHTVFHLAARVGSVEMLHGSDQAELLALQTNLVIDANVFRACLVRGVRRIVYASSVSVYPIDRQAKLDTVFREEDLYPINPEGGYGWAKLMGEVQLHWMRGVDIGIARIFGVYGEHEEPDENAHAVPALLRKAVLYPREEFLVWGDGDQTRDLLYVADTVEALVRLEERVSFPPAILNVGSGQAVSVRELVQRVNVISGKGINPEYDPTRPVGPRSRTADVRRAMVVLGWEPRVDLEEGLRRTFRWVAERVEVARCR